MCEINTVLNKSKNMQENCNFNVKNDKISKNIANFREDIETKKGMSELKMKAYAKALLTIYPTLPNIVSIVDGIVEKRASSSISLSSVYAGSIHTYKQIEKVIDLSERKYKLLNIFSLIKEIITPLNLRDYEIVDLKFFRRHKFSEIADRLEMEERSLYRRINKILDSIVKFMSINLIDEQVIEDLIRGEGWIKEIYNKAYAELMVNKVRSSKNRNRVKMEV